MSGARPLTAVTTADLAAPAYSAPGPLLGASHESFPPSKQTALGRGAGTINVPMLQMALLRPRLNSPSEAKVVKHRASVRPGPRDLGA